LKYLHSPVPASLKYPTDTGCLLKFGQSFPSNYRSVSLAISQQMAVHVSSCPAASLPSKPSAGALQPLEILQSICYNRHTRKLVKVKLSLP